MAKILKRILRYRLESCIVCILKLGCVCIACFSLLIKPSVGKFLGNVSERKSLIHSKQFNALQLISAASGNSFVFCFARIRNVSRDKIMLNSYLLPTLD